MWEVGRDVCWDGLFFILGLHENVSTRDNYIHTYVRTYVRTYTYIHTYIHSFIETPFTGLFCYNTQGAAQHCSLYYNMKKLKRIINYKKKVKYN